MVIVNVELNDDVKNKDEFWSKFKHGLEGFKMQVAIRSSCFDG